VRVPSLLAPRALRTPDVPRALVHPPSRETVRLRIFVHLGSLQMQVAGAATRMMSGRGVPVAPRAR